MILIFILINIMAFAFMGYDKHQAKAKGRRIPEKTLLLLALLGGSLGIGLGMHLFHHKTRQLSFRISVPILFVLQLYLLSVYTF